mmetsp:Transcript_8710/g.16898  ORF Transcript_8710/g.16898 Transcript_8710/m.16898 type:complete len:96 (-) Transcript_8710:685-972(-)
MLIDLSGKDAWLDPPSSVDGDTAGEGSGDFAGECVEVRASPGGDDDSQLLRLPRDESEWAVGEMRKMGFLSPSDTLGAAWRPPLPVSAGMPRARS